METLSIKEFSTKEVRTALKELLSKKKVQKVELKTIGAVRGKLTKLRNKASKWTSQLYKLSNEADYISGDAFNLAGDFEPLKEAAKELGIPDIVTEIEGDINAAMDLRKRASFASDNIYKAAKKLDLS